ncbi:MAG TPA: helix-turn-helix domain-containing protein, partial [Roseiarcus sp.]|nr:helix-turn-helix domain-containing protein [Roseiarcus sp.]
MSIAIRAMEEIVAVKVPSVKRYVVRLSAEERQQLEAMIRKGKSPAQRLLKARILLKSDVSEDSEGWSDSRIIEALETSVSMVYRVRKQLVEEGLEAVLSRTAPAAPAVPRIFDGEKEARLIALACSKPPEGYGRWSDCWRAKWWSSASSRRPATVRSSACSKNALQPHRRKYWVIPPKTSGAFVAAMGDVLSVYTRPRDPDRPVVCLDETSK